MENKKVQLKFRAVNKDIFEAILNGTKKIETRAATTKFKNLKAGEIVLLVCGKDQAEKKIKKTQTFKSIGDLVSVYKVSDINPDLKTHEQLTKMYYSFPNYKEKIDKNGLIAIEFEEVKNEK